LIITISDTCKNQPKRLDFDNTINLSSLIVSLGKRNSRARLPRRFRRTTRVPNSPFMLYIVYCAVVFFSLQHVFRPRDGGPRSPIALGSTLSVRLRQSVDLVDTLKTVKGLLLLERSLCLLYVVMCYMSVICYMSGSHLSPTPVSDDVVSGSSPSLFSQRPKYKTYSTVRRSRKQHQGLVSYPRCHLSY
jgi:hypothetical protein